METLGTEKMNYKNPFIIACIPAYKEEEHIGNVVSETMKYVDKVLVCDDGSGDETGSIAKNMGAHIILHDQNLGYGAALQSLFNEARRLEADIVVTIDGDGQHNPNDIYLLVERLDKGDVDIVIGSRFLEGAGSEAPGWRKTGIKAITMLVSNVGLTLTDATSGFRAYNKRALGLLKFTEDGMGASTEILLNAKENDLKVTEVPIWISYGEGSMKNNPLILGLEILLTTIKHLSMRRPLFFYGLPGFLALFVSTIFWVMTIRIFTLRGTISTNIALIALSTTMVGLILMTTAIILWTLISVIRERLHGL